MSERSWRIAVAFTNPVDQKLVSDFLTSLGYATVALSRDSVPQADLFIMNAPAARRFGRPVLEQKRKTEVFLPVVIALKAGEPVAPWLATGFDDNLRLPFTKAELERRVEILLRVRQQSQELARSVEARYQAIFEGVNVAIWEEDFSTLKAALDALRTQGVVDFRAYLEAHPEFVEQAADMLDIRDVNAEALHMFGAKSKTELLNAWAQTMTAESRSVFREELIALAEDKRHFESELVAQTLQGKRIHVLMKLAIATGNNAFEHALISMTDITERVRAEEALRLSEEKFRKAFMASPDAVNINRLDDGCYEQINPGFTRIMGYREEDVIGHTSLDLGIWVNPQDRQRLVEGLRTTGIVTDLQAQFRAKDGNIHIGLMSAAVIDIDGEPHILSITRDISHYIATQHALQESEERFRLLFEQSPEAILLTRLEDGQIVAVNQAFASLTGYSKADALGKTTLTLGIWNDPADQERLVTALQEAGSVRNFEMRYKRKDGESSLASLSTTLLTIDGETHLLTTLQDISERRRIEAELQTYRTHLEELVAARTAEVEKLNHGMLAMLEDLREANSRYKQTSQELQAANEELKTFSYSVSHDLKAPLRGIDGYSRLLLEDYHDRLDEDGRFFLTNIRQATSQMNQLIDDLLAYSRMERRVLTAKTFSLTTLIEGLLVEKRAEIEASRAEVSLHIACAEITADRDGLTIALRNLLDNAIKFSAGAAQPKIEIGSKAQNNHCVIWVKDNGIGFDMQYQDRIFEIFQRLHTPEAYPGTGVGLAIVRKAMQRMRGRVWAESTPGAGATFYLEVPQ